MTLSAIIKNNQDGVSFVRKGLDYQPVYFKTGFFVSLTDNQANPQNYQTTIEKIDNLAHFLNLKKYYYGFWSDTGHEFLDLSLHLKNKLEALAIAKVFNQQAIFDCSKLESIYLR